MIDDELATKIGLFLKAFEKELVGTAIEFPVDIAGRLANGILAVLGKFNRKAMKWTSMQADEETFHNLACKEVQRLVFL